MINCTITSPKKTTVYKNVRSIMLPAFSGQMQILPGHAESFILLQKGNISLRQLSKLRKKVNFLQNGQDKIIQIMNGECHIKNDAVTIIL